MTSTFDEITVAQEDPRQPEMETLIFELNAFLSAQTPPEFCFQLTIDQMVSDDVVVLVARDGYDRALGCGALRILPASWGDRWGEVKRMYVKDEAKGRGVGSRILETIEAEARTRGLTRLVLETGLQPTHPGAHATYIKAGFTERGTFGDYPNSDWNVFFEKPL